MARYEKTITLVDCERLGQALPALKRQPFPGELGERIYNNISALAWSMWQQQSTILINHYGLHMGDPRAQEFLMEQMEEFLFGGGGQQVNMDPATAAGAGARKK
ncbi:MAG: oxidative damage protection protein [Candidatus Promineifilaceae bacterium]|nr:oxidative damage protection protein [Candidatus Promineifilaceae bacterium]